MNMFCEQNGIIEKDGEQYLDLGNGEYALIITEEDLESLKPDEETKH